MPPPPRRLSPGTGLGPEPKATLSPRDASAIQSPGDELGRRDLDYEARDEEDGAEEEDAEEEREALSSERYGDVSQDPYANLGDAFGAAG